MKSHTSKYITEYHFDIITRWGPDDIPPIAREPPRSHCYVEANFIGDSATDAELFFGKGMPFQLRDI